MPPAVRHIVVVDDASPDDIRTALHGVSDPRLTVLRHEVNRGVGGAMKTGFQRALDLGADIIVKIDGDGQMDPALLPQFIDPLIHGDADMTKGNRFDDLGSLQSMPVIRRLGNLALSFLVKMASGYWRVFDPCNGYIAIDARTLRRINRDRLDERYFFEISLLCESYFARARMLDVPMAPVYDTETSSLNPLGTIPNFTGRLLGRASYRVFKSYFMRDFNVVSLFLVIGVPALVFGIIWSLYHWIHLSRLNVFASTGTVMIGVLSIVLGFQLVLQAIVLDVENEPGRFRR
jgi:dolichol-phosphate mannosyltransferase